MNAKFITFDCTQQEATINNCTKCSVYYEPTRNESYNLGYFEYDKKQGAWVYWSKGYLGEETGTTYEASLDDSQEELIDDFSGADDESWQYMLKWNNQY